MNNGEMEGAENEEIEEKLKGKKGRKIRNGGGKWKEKEIEESKGEVGRG
jgi:hypothetical protein